MGSGGQQLYEEYAYVLDFMPFGKADGKPRYKAGSVVQLIGEAHFTLLEANVRTGVTLSINERVYVGKNLREEITYIIGRISFDELTTNAKMEIDNVVEKMVVDKEGLFVNFFNTAQARTPRTHALELIPGIGKKYMWKIIDERGIRPFDSFSDLQERVNILNPAKLIAKRILEELEGSSKHRLFTRPV